MAGQLKIESMYAFIALDPEDNTEGIPALMGPGGMAMPMVGADMERVDQLRPVAHRMANELGLEIRLVHFTTRTDVEIITPEKTSD